MDFQILTKQEAIKYIKGLMEDFIKNQDDEEGDYNREVIDDCYFYIDQIREYKAKKVKFEDCPMTASGFSVRPYNEIAENIAIVGSQGEYKDFPYKKELMMYGTCIWCDDFPTDVSNQEVIDAFIKHLEEVRDEL